MAKSYHQLTGSFALAIIVDDAQEIFVMRKDSPLVIAHNDQGSFVASDMAALLSYTNEYYLLDHHQIAHLQPDGVTFYDLSLNQIVLKQHKTTFQKEQIQKHGFAHYMLKEIHEQPDVVTNFLHYYTTSEPHCVNHIPDLSAYNQVHIVGCGSAMHAGLIAKHFFEQAARIPVSVEIASEYRCKNPILTPETLVIIVSQSGETADSLAALRQVKMHGIKTLAVVNVIDSSIAREAD